MKPLLEKQNIFAKKTTEKSFRDPSGSLQLLEGNSADGQQDSTLKEEFDLTSSRSGICIILLTC